MEEEIKDTLIQCEKENEVKFSFPFKLILGISIFLTSVLTLGGIIFTYKGIIEKIWMRSGLQSFLDQILLNISILIFLILLISIAIIKKPFSRILVRCLATIGIIFVAASILFPRFSGFETHALKILSNGKYTLIDGIYFIIGLLGILFSKIIHYGLIYQRDADMTV